MERGLLKGGHDQKLCASTWSSVFHPQENKLSKDTCKLSLTRLCYCSLAGYVSLYLP